MCFCGAIFASNYKRTRHSFKDILWYFGSNLCIICETKFDSLPKLFEHCTTTQRQEIVKLRKKTISIVQEHRDFTESSAENTRAFLEGLVQRKYTTNFDRSDGILDCIDLFLNPPVKMNTPEPDNGQ